ncbi:MAG: enoyl-CoA hydratase/isomerase family protein [Chloroflexota bacterium]
MGIEYTKAGAVATFTLANGKVNPLTLEMHREMLAALRDFTADPDLKVGILTGAGDRAFSAGDDIRNESPTSGDTVTDLLGAMGRGPARVEDPDPMGWDPADGVLTFARTKPIIGAVRGWCLGRGLHYLLNLTEIRIATPDARFGLPEIAYGMGGIAGTMQLARYLPRTTAWEMALTGDPIDAAEALRVHLVNRVVEPDDLLPEARRIADAIARHPALAIRTEMELLRRTEDLHPDAAHALGMGLYRAQRLAIGESDVQAAFLYKR